ncbi:MAG: vWA domain-containing protein [Ferruginibacter sp.]
MLWRFLRINNLPEKFTRFQLLLMYFRLFIVQFLLFFYANPVLCQSLNQVDIEIVNNQFKPLPNLEVLLLEQSSADSISAITDKAGKVHFDIKGGGVWNLFVSGYLYEKSVISFSDADKGTGSRNIYITHDTAYNNRLRQQTFDRNNFQTVMINPASVPARPPAGYSLLQLGVVNSEGKKLAGKSIRVVDVKNRKIYAAVTNASGLALFLVPGTNRYDIDVEEQLNASLMDVENDKPSVYSEDVVYDAYDMKEMISNDTVIQLINFPVNEKSSRALYRISMRRREGEINHENVFLNEIGSIKVYRSKTDEKGDAFFILPFGKKFMLHFNYQRDVDVIDLLDARQYASGYREVTYLPDPALEHPESYIPALKKLVLTDFEYYHRIPYPKPVENDKPGMILRPVIPLINQNSNEMLLEMGLSTYFPGTVKRLPLNMSFVLDKSGSMAGYDRIEGLKEGFDQLIEKLLPDDIISIILYNDGMELLLPAQRVGLDKNRLKALVKRIQPSGGTDMLKALQTGYQQVLKNYNGNSINSVVLLTDGYDINSADTIINMQQPFNDKINCTGIGVGNDYNYDLLKQLVTKGGGLFSFAGKGKELADIFADGIIRNVSPVAKDIRVEIQYDKTLRVKNVFGLMQPVIKNNAISARLPYLAAFSEKTVLINFEPDAGFKADKETPVKISLHYLNVITGKSEIIEKTVNLQKSINPSSEKQALAVNAEQKKMFAIAFSNDCLLKMVNAFAEGNIRAAQVQVNQGLARLKQLYKITGDDNDIVEMIKKMDTYLLALKNLENKRKLENYK